ncbi:MAG: CYTH domain-containing protein [Elusimicrobia bacterium]|nr:CYTH domain-containing protein [Elusimicrobiota bacterium]
MRDQAEVEAKWSVRSERGFAVFREEAVARGAVLGRTRSSLIKDSYLDTPGSFFGSRRVSCRLRRASGSWELTLKGMTRLKGGVADRREKTFPLGRLKTRGGALARVRRLLRRVPGHEGLEERFVIFNRRTVVPVRLPGGVKAECSFDRAGISRGRKVVRMLEIELELMGGSRPAFSSFVRRLNSSGALLPAVRSKVATALRAFGLGLPASGDPEEAFALASDAGS